MRDDTLRHHLAPPPAAMDQNRIWEGLLTVFFEPDQAEAPGTESSATPRS